MQSDSQAIQDFPEAHRQTITRRQMLLSMAAATAAAALNGALPEQATAMPAALSAAEGKINRAVAPQVAPFALPDVRLLDGPFKRAMETDGKYLLSLEPDRMLANFRTNAGLEPKAPVYGGWESVRTWADIRAHGHTAGHYLSACAMMYASTGDERFKQRCDYIVTDLKQCQDADKTGLICAFPDKTAQFDNAIAGRRITGVPWYTTHKVMAGLRDAYVHCKNQTALDVLTKLCDWADTATKEMTEEQFQRMLGTEHGGMNEVLADVYVLTGNDRYLKLAQRFCHKAVLEPLAQNRDTLDRLHSNTQIPKFVGFARLHELTGKADYDAASKFFWKTIVETRSFITGGNGDGEHFFPINDFASHLSSAKTMETCCTYNMLKLTRMLFEQDPSAAYADYYERALYNCILASQDPDSGMMTYFQPTRPGYFKLFHTPIDSFWCCTGSGMENHSKYGDSIYFRGADALFVNLFIPSTVNWKEQGLTLTQTTSFPDEPSTKLKLTLSRPSTIELNIRHPAWCRTLTVKVNGKVEATSQNAGSYVALQRTWSDGDLIEVDLPMTIRAVPLPGTTDTLAIAYGPIVLVGRLGTLGYTPGADIIVNERTIGQMLNDRIEVPALRGDATTLAGAIKPVAGAPLTFTAPAAAGAEPVTLIPYFRMAHERYNMYWKLG